MSSSPIEMTSTHRLYPPNADSTPTTVNSSHPPKPRSRLFSFIDPHLRELRNDPTVLVTSDVVSSRTLLYIRAFFAFWVTLLIPFNLAKGEAERYLFYFTNLTWLGLGVWFYVSTFQTWRFNRDGNMNRFLAQSKVTQWLTWNLYLMAAVYSWIVPIVFWSLLSGDLIKTGTAYSWFTNLSVHATDLLMIITELVLNRISLFYSQWPSVIAAGLAFLGYAFFQHAVYHNLSPSERTGDYKDGWWVYGFLDTAKPGAAKYYIVLPLAFILFFVAVVAVHKFRNRRRAEATKADSQRGLVGSRDGAEYC